MTRKMIDMRNRPAFLHKFYGAEPDTPEYAVARWLNRRVGSKNDEHFTGSIGGMASYVDEIRAAGINAAEVVGRDTPDLSISNERILEITVPYPPLIGVASVDQQ